MINKALINNELLQHGQKQNCSPPPPEYVYHLRDLFRHSKNTRVRQQAYRELVMLGYDPMGSNL